LNLLNAGRADDTNAQRLNGHVHADLLVTDDFDFKPLVSPAAKELRNVIYDRYETGSSLITNNRAQGGSAGWFRQFKLALTGQLWVKIDIQLFSRVSLSHSLLNISQNLRTCQFTPFFNRPAESCEGMKQKHVQEP